MAHHLPLDAMQSAALGRGGETSSRRVSARPSERERGQKLVKGGKRRRIDSGGWPGAGIEGRIGAHLSAGQRERADDVIPSRSVREISRRPSDVSAESVLYPLNRDSSRQSTRPLSNAARYCAKFSIQTPYVSTEKIGRAPG